eukprot:6486366-Amphidinium_carterae.1
MSCAILIHKVLKWMNVEVCGQIGLAMDSSAGKAIISRLGVGAIRHLEVKTMWLQLLHKKRSVKVLKVWGKRNVADVGTKVLQPGRFQMLAEMMCMKIMDIEAMVEREPEKRGKGEKSVRKVDLQLADGKVLTALVLAAETFVKHARGEELTASSGTAAPVCLVAARERVQGQTSLCMKALVVVLGLALIIRWMMRVGMKADRVRVGMKADRVRVGSDR